MEHSLRMLTFDGSILEAITEAKRQKKLFIVYVSGEDDESTRLDTSTWADSHVAECITKYCILLHLLEGSTDAANFSMIYPQKSAPCITAVGYNGVLLWQNEGYITPENLASSLEKAWLSLQIQETTASVLTAALSARKAEQFQNEASSGPISVSSEKGDSSSSCSSMPPEQHIKSSKSEVVGPSQMPDPAKENGSVVRVSQLSERQSDLKIDHDGQSVPVIEAVGEQSSDSDTVNCDNPEVCRTTNRENQCLTTQDSKISNNRLGISEGNSKLINRDVKGGLDDEASAVSGQEASSSNFKKENISTDVLLNIRLPNGVNLRDKFLKTSALRVVKDWVDQNLVDFHGSYDLAVPYPRKVFKDQDLAQSLEDLGIINRQSLIVVPRQRATHQMQRSETSAFDTDTDLPQGRIGGYFAFVKRVLSYVNPFSYLLGGGGGSSSGSGSSGSSSSVQESGNGLWQFSSDATMQSDSVSQNPRQSSSDFNAFTSTINNSRIRRRQTASSGFGANIHTLKHDDDGNTLGDRNTYWNGNSTQFGGNDDDKR